MGYTNYWYQTRSFTNDEWDKIVTHFENMVKDSSVKTESVILTNDFDDPIIWIQAEPQCETFQLSKTPTNEFNFCKTQQLPYDKVVWGLLKYIKEEVVGLNKSEFRIVNDNGEEIV